MHSRGLHSDLPDCPLMADQVGFLILTSAPDCYRGLILKLSESHLMVVVIIAALLFKDIIDFF